MIRRGCIYLLFISSAISLVNCKQDAGVLNLPGSLGDNYFLAFTDTVRVNCSTVLLDSLPTSGRGVLLLGKYSDPKFGTIEASPYFQIGLFNSSGSAQSWIPSVNAVYDSLVLRLKYSDYHYGDLDQPQTIEVRRVLEDFNDYKIPFHFIDVGLYSYLGMVTSQNGLQLNSISNIKSFKVDELEVLGSKTVTINPVRSKKINIRLSDNLGLELFNKKRENSTIYKIESVFPYDVKYYDYRFISFFKGIALRSLNSSNVIGLNTKDCMVSLYYKDLVDGALDTTHVDFSYYGALKSFHQIKVDRAGTPMEDLTPNNALPSGLTMNESYIQSGTGIVTKLTFPSIANIINLPGFRQISAATLIIEPIKYTYDDQNFYLPKHLILSYTNRTNLPLSAVQSNFSSSPQIAQIGYNSGNDFSPSYSFNITQYVQQLVSSQPSFKDVALIVSTPAYGVQGTEVENIYRTVTRTCIGGEGNGKFRTRIEIYYTKDKSININ